MKRAFGLALIGLVSLSLAACESPTNDGGGAAFQKLTYTEALAEASKQKKVVMIDFGASWCGPCRQMEKTTFTDAGVQNFLRQHTVALKVDVDQQQELAVQFGIQNIPVMLFLDANGKELGRLVGSRTAQQFLSEAAQFKQ